MKLWSRWVDCETILVLDCTNFSKKALQLWGLCANKPKVIAQDQLYMKVNREENMQILGFYSSSL